MSFFGKALSKVAPALNTAYSKIDGGIGVARTYYSSSMGSSVRSTATNLAKSSIRSINSGLGYAAIGGGAALGGAVQYYNDPRRRLSSVASGAARGALGGAAVMAYQAGFKALGGKKGLMESMASSRRDLKVIGSGISSWAKSKWSYVNSWSSQMKDW